MTTLSKYYIKILFIRNTKVVGSFSNSNCTIVNFIMTIIYFWKLVWVFLYLHLMLNSSQIYFEKILSPLIDQIFDQLWVENAYSTQWHFSTTWSQDTISMLHSSSLQRVPVLPMEIHLGICIISSPNFWVPYAIPSTLVYTFYKEI